MEVSKEDMTKEKPDIGRHVYEHELIKEEAINGWAKHEMFIGFGIGESDNVPAAAE